MTQGITAAPAPQGGTSNGSMPTTGRWGWYQDHEGAIYRRTSTLVKEVETDTHNLEKWKLRQVLIGAARRGDLVTAVKAMGNPDPMTGWTREQKKLQDELAEKAAEAAKDTDGAITGTAMHTMTERIDRGEQVDAVLAAELPAAVEQSLRTYAALRKLNGWHSVEIERTVVLDELEVAGTFDRVDLIPGLAALLGPGVCQYGHGPDDEHFGGYDDRPFDELPVTVDVKTEKDPTLNGLHIGPQLAIYSRAKRMWRPTGGTHDLVRDGKVVQYASGDPVQVPNGEYVAAPCVRQDVAVVVHVHNGDANPLLLNLAEGWDAAVAAYEQIQRKARAKRRVGAVGAWFAPLPTKRPSTLTSFTETAVARQYADPYRPGPGLVVAAAPGQVGEVVNVGGIDFTRKVAADDVGAASFGLDAGSGSAVVHMCGPGGAVTYATSGAEAVGGHGSMPPVVAAPPAADDPTAGLCPNCAPLIIRASATRVDGTTGESRCATCANATPEAADGPMSAGWSPQADQALREGAADEATKEVVRGQLIAAIWQARTIDALAILWKMANDRGLKWVGPIEMAGDARRRQIECVQRAGHIPGTVKCACGWMAGQVA